MSFCVVQSRKTKKALPSMIVVPANWVEDKFVYFPPNSIITLSQDEKSYPDKQSRKRQKCKVLGRTKTFQQAEEMMNVLEKVTDSEDAAQMGHGTRTTPAKKQPKFTSKSYNLVPQQWQKSGSNIETCAAGSPKNPEKLQTTSDFPLLAVGSPVHAQDFFNTLKQRSDTIPQPTTTAQSCQSDDNRMQTMIPNLANISIQNVEANSNVQKNVALEPNTSKDIRIISVTSSHSQDVNSIASAASSSRYSFRVCNSSQVSNHEIANYETTALVADHGVQPVPIHALRTPSSFTPPGIPIQQVVGNNSGNSVSQQITLPIVIGSDGKQYAQLANGFYYAIMDINNENVDGSSANIKQDELDLGIDQNTMNSSNPELEEPAYSTIDSELRKLNDRLDVYNGMLSKLATEVHKTNDRLNIQEGLLVKLTEFMANFNKLMASKTSDNTMSTVTRQEEDFSEYESMTKISSDQSFKAFEQNLGDPAFLAKFFRYLHSIYSLNGKRDSGPLFRTIIRRFVTPNVFIPYSWMGNKRTKKVSTGESGNNLNFQETFPNFIKLMHQVLQAADYSSTREQNEQLFKNLLRYKVLELKRFENGSGEHRASSSRKRQKRQKVEVSAVSAETNDQASLDGSSQTPTAIPEPLRSKPSRSSESDTGSETDNGDTSSSEDDV